MLHGKSVCAQSNGDWCHPWPCDNGKGVRMDSKKLSVICVMMSGAEGNTIPPII